MPGPGEEPHSIEKQASLRSRWGLSPAATSSAPAVSWPMPRAPPAGGLRWPSWSLAWATWLSRWVSTPTVIGWAAVACAMLVMAVSSRWLGRDGTRAGRADSTVIGLGDRLVSGHVRPAGVPMVAAAGADRSRARHQAGGGRGQALAATTTARSSQWWENEAPTTRAGHAGNAPG